MHATIWRAGLDRLRGLPPEERYCAARARLAAQPRCPVAGYLAACHEFDTGRPATAVRRMMVVHHAEPSLESAALLVFAGLNWSGRREHPLLEVLVSTWEEFRRPEFDRTPREQELLGQFAEAGQGLPQVSPLARRLWRLPLETVRVQLQEVAADQNRGAYPLLLATA